MKIINLTQHKASAEQIAEGVEDMSGNQLERLHKLLTFDRMPPPGIVKRRAQDIAELYHSAKYTHAMIGGAPWLMPPLEKALRARGTTPLYAFSKRIVIEDDQGKKVSRFEHEGFIEGGTKV